MFVVKKPTICYFIFIVLIYIDSYSTFILNLRHSRTIEAAYSLLTILTASFNHTKFTRKFTFLVTLLMAICHNAIYCVTVILNVQKIDYLRPDVMIGVGIYILIFCFSLLHDLRSHKIVYIIVALSVTIFIHDLLLSFVEIFDIVINQLNLLLLQVSFVYLSAYYFHTRCLPCCSEMPNM